MARALFCCMMTFLVSGQDSALLTSPQLMLKSCADSWDCVEDLLLVRVALTVFPVDTLLPMLC
jgi:hypothetical protein